MINKFIALISLLLCSTWGHLNLATAATDSGQLASVLHLQSAIDRIDYPWRVPTRQLYENNDWKLFWIYERGISGRAETALDVLGMASNYGLRPDDYNISDLERFAVEIEANQPEKNRLTDFDVGLSTALMRFVSDIHRGRINPLDTGFKVVAERKSLDLAKAVFELARAKDFNETLVGYEPRLQAYHRLKMELARYRILAGEVRPPNLDTSRTIHPGDTYADTEALASLLFALGDIEEPAGSADKLYTGSLVDGVKRFQARHGLEPDGVIGPKTFAQLVTPMERRIEQIELSMERLRWLPHPGDGQHIVVNIPAYELYGFKVEGGVGSLITRMKVIVGSAINKHETPVFVANMDYLVYRPYWNVPKSITTKELLPLIRNDPAYLATHQYEILQGQQVIDATELTPEILSGLESGRLWIRQAPGETNALGLIKFIFPNSSSVYLHDTPAHQLFEQSRRDFSHGCIRVEDPVRLAEFVLENQEAQWDRNDILAALDGQDDNTVGFNKPIPVHIFYTTAIVRDNGEIRFFDDIYGHDRALRQLLADHSANG